MEFRKAIPISIAPVLLAVAASAQTPTAQNAARDEAVDLKSLQAEVRSLRDEVKSLKEARRADQDAALAAGQDPRSQTARQERSTADLVLHDADQQSRMLDLSALSAGWSENHGFFIRSEDDRFLLSPFLLFQLRNATLWRQEAKTGGSDDTQNGFEVRRLQLGFDGHVFSPDLTYRIFWQSSPVTTGNLSLLLAWVQYRIHDTPWVIGGGQFKDPLDHEQLISDAKQLAVERTFVDDTLAGGEAFSKGVTLRYDDGSPFRAEGAFTSGFNNNNTTFAGFPTNAQTFGFAARGEYKFMGRWRDYDHFTSQGNDGDLLVVGGGVDWSEAGHTDAIRHVIDAQYNPGKFGLYGAYLGRYTSGNPLGRHSSTYDPSVRLQASYLLTRQWDVFARFDYVHLDGKEFKARTKTSVPEFTLGGVYYLYGQNAKLTLDLSYLPDGTPASDNGNNILANPGHADLLFRGQFQLLL